MENKNKGLIITIIVLVVCLLGACGYIAYDKLIKKEEPKQEEKVDKKEENQNTNNNYDHISIGNYENSCAILENSIDNIIVSGIRLNNKDYTLKYERSRDYADKYYLNDNLFYAETNDMDFYKVCNYNNYIIITESFPSGTQHIMIFDNYGAKNYDYLGRYNYNNGILNIYADDKFSDDDDLPVEEREKITTTHYTVDLKANDFKLEYIGVE